MHTKKATKYVGVKRKSCRLNQTPHTGNIRIRPHVCGRSAYQSTQFGHFSHLDSRYRSRSRKSRAPSSVDLVANLVFLFLVQYGKLVSPVMSSVLTVPCCRSHMCGIFNNLMFVLALADGLYCTWLLYPTWVDTVVRK
jgi:hypothetical protein